MRVFDILTEAVVDSAETLKSSFTPDQWVNIVRSLKKDDLNKVKTAPERENKINTYNKEFGPQFYAQDPTRWMSVAKLNGVNVPTIVRSWQDIYDFLSAHTAPVDLTPATPDPAASGTNNTTPETFAEVEGWIVGPADGIFVKKDPEPTPNDLYKYVVAFITKLLAKRGPNYKTEFTRNNKQNTMYGNYIAAVNQINEQYNTPNGITKKQVDTVLYGMMTSVDSIFAATQATP